MDKEVKKERKGTRKETSRGAREYGQCSSGFVYRKYEEPIHPSYSFDIFDTDDLVGLKVSHDFEDLNEGDARILTLKDSRILDNEGACGATSRISTDFVLLEDELHNVEMAEDAHTQKINDLKIKKRTYTGYDDDEFVPGNEGMKRAVLAKYDEDIDGAKEIGFRLGSSTKPIQVTRSKKEEASPAVNKSLLSIDYASQFFSCLNSESSLNLG